MKGILILAGKGQRIIHGLGYNHTSQQICNHAFVLGITVHQFGSKADDALILQYFCLLEVATTIHTGNRKEGCTTQMILLQEINHALRCLFILGNNVLDVTAKSGLNGNLVLLLYVNQVCNNAMDTGILVLLLHNGTNTLTVSVITLCNILQRL